MTKIKVGIFFGGSSREREISFAGGRTVFDNLNKSIFEAVPIFVDSHHNLILLDWEYIYKGTIRDFYPPSNHIPKTEFGFQVYIESIEDLDTKKNQEIISSVGTPIKLEELKETIDLAFLALHGDMGEDGQIQGLLEYLKIPYTGSGIFPSAIGIDKFRQKKWMKLADFYLPSSFAISKSSWSENKTDFYDKAKKEIGFPLVVRPVHQGSSIGVSILKNEDQSGFIHSVNHAFFERTISYSDWNEMSEEAKIQLIQVISDIRDGLGFPLILNGQKIFHPDKLFKAINDICKTGSDCTLKAENAESQVLVEEFIDGREFSTIVMKKEDGTLTALPPTEIVKGNEVYDYRSKYLPGLSRKLTPIDLPTEDIQRIQEESKKLMDLFEFDCYARIDGFIKADGKIFLNDPNTTSGMLPSSFFFHQAAELGLNPSQFLSYIIYSSLQDRKKTGVFGQKITALIERLNSNFNNIQSADNSKKKIAVIFGGYSSERHISVESGRNIYEKLASSEKYEPIPIFLLGDESKYELYKIPINLVLKDNADDIRDKVLNYEVHDIIQILKNENSEILNKYVGQNFISKPEAISIEQLANEVEAVFLALHGRPGEDGNIQQKLEAHNIPFNGSPSFSANQTIDKFETLQTLKKNGFVVAEQLLVDKTAYQENSEKTVDSIIDKFAFPFILKPVDDGCSSAVQIIRDKEQLQYYLKGIFRSDESQKEWRDKLKLKYNEEFPMKNFALVEELITSNGAKQFMEITTGLLTHKKNGELSFEMFEPSEALASGEILSLEEKFLAGEGQNITPARFGTDQESYKRIAKHVKEDLQKASKILNVEGYARIDAFVRVYDNNSVETVIIEVNSLPGMTPATCIFHQAALNGYKPFDFIDGILNFAFARNEAKKLVN